MTQVEFAERLGVPQAAISQLETGSYALGRRVALLIVDTFRPQMRRHRITVEDLLRGHPT